MPRAYEALVRDRVKFRVGKIVFVAFSADETLMGFGFPKEERAALVAAEPAQVPAAGHRGHALEWCVARLSALDQEEMGQLVTRRLADVRAEERGAGVGRAPGPSRRAGRASPTASGRAVGDTGPRRNPPGAGASIRPS